MVRHAIEEALAEALKSLGEPETPFSVSAPEKGFGDYSTNAALIAAKESRIHQFPFVPLFFY